MGHKSSRTPSALCKESTAGLKVSWLFLDNCCPKKAILFLPDALESTEGGEAGYFAPLILCTNPNVLAKYLRVSFICVSMSLN